jgi:hypothetical protein
MAGKHSGLWALVRFYGRMREPVIIGTDRDTLERIGDEYVRRCGGETRMMGSDGRASYEIRGVEIDLASFDLGNILRHAGPER